MNHCYDYWSSEANPQRPTFNRSDKRVLDELDIVPRQLASVPHCALFLSFQFTLETAYLSKNDRMAISKDGHQLLIHDNPIKMEWAFRVPMVSATTWKGNLRAATRILVADPQNEEQWKPRLEMLLGTETEKGDKDNRLLEKGRLNFFPSYFAKVEKDILNPRNRKTRTGTTPIRLEQVPPLQTARFAVLYTPFDLLWMDEAAFTGERELDLTLLGTALASMFVEFGFGAKKTLGLGKAGPDLADVVLQNDNGRKDLGTKSVNELPSLAQWEKP